MAAEELAGSVGPSSRRRSTSRTSACRLRDALNEMAVRIAVSTCAFFRHRGLDPAHHGAHVGFSTVPQVSRWIKTAVTKKRTSRIGHAHCHLVQRSRSGRPKFCWFERLLNLGPTGSAAPRRHAERGLQRVAGAEIARASRSSASGNYPRTSSGRAVRLCSR